MTNTSSGRSIMEFNKIYNSIEINIKPSFRNILFILLYQIFARNIHMNIKSLNVFPPIKRTVTLSNV